MNNSVRNTLGIIVGVIIGGAINGGIVVIGPMIIPPPGGVDMSSVQCMSAGIHLRRISVATSNQTLGSARGTNKRVVYALHYLMSGWQLAQLNIAHMLAPAESS